LGGLHVGGKPRKKKKKKKKRERNGNNKTGGGRLAASDSFVDRPVFTSSLLLLLRYKELKLLDCCRAGSVISSIDIIHTLLEGVVDPPLFRLPHPFPLVVDVVLLFRTSPEIEQPIQKTRSHD
jgi:hypothetical protein